MNKKLIPILTGVAGLALVSVVVFIQVNKNEAYSPVTVGNQLQAVTSTNPSTTGAQDDDDDDVKTPTISSTPATSQNNPVISTSYTLAQVAVHKDASSCWSAVNGNVYDLSSWIAKHPGGEKAILSICGKDGSAAFNGQHEGQEKQADVLATFKIGALSE